MPVSRGVTPGFSLAERPVQWSSLGPTIRRGWDRGTRRRRARNHGVRLTESGMTTGCRRTWSFVARLLAAFRRPE